MPLSSQIDGLFDIAWEEQLDHPIREHPYLNSADLALLTKRGAQITKTLKDPVQQLLQDVPTREAQLRQHYRDLANLASGINEQLPRIAAAQLPKIDVPHSLDLLKALGAIGNTHKAFVESLQKADEKNVVEKLGEGITRFSSSWTSLPKVVDANAETFVSGFRGLVGSLNGERLPGVPALAATLSAAGVFPQATATALGQASTAIGDFMSKKGDYTNAASTLIGTLSSLDKAGIPIPGFKQVAPILNTATSLLRAAGPLTTLAGFATGLSAFSLVGGLGGLGGGNDDAVNQALAQINAKLDQMDKKLDQILSDLRKLDDKITQYHFEEMHALEGIMHEVVLTRRLLENDIHRQVKEPCERARDEHEMNSPKQLDLCMDGLSNTYAGPAPLKQLPDGVAFEVNVRNYNVAKPLQKTALDRWQDELTLRSDLAAEIKNTNCQGLVYPSADLDELDRRYNEYAKQTEASNCATILQSNLVEPGLMSAGNRKPCSPRQG